MQAAIAGNNSQIEKKPAVLCVLVVDDEALLRWSLAETLAADGCHVFEATNAADALTLVRRAPHAVDVVLLDLDLPDSAAVSLLSAIRRLAPRATVILMTAFGRDDIVRKALDLGTFRVLDKPFDINDVSDLVAQALVARHSPNTH
jgi:DNA-binding NtrC family response regulator